MDGSVVASLILVERKVAGMPPFDLKKAIAERIAKEKRIALANKKYYAGGKKINLHGAPCKVFHQLKEKKNETLRS
jgi:hypothetical protein